MYGAIIGDIVGSVYEFNNIKTKKFPLFSERSIYTDDSIMTIAVAKSLMESRDMMLVRARITPLYIKVEEKSEYLDALEHADLTGDYTKLYIFLFQILLRRNAELCS